jgi:hypothetical protein
VKAPNSSRLAKATPRNASWILTRITQPLITTPRNFLSYFDPPDAEMSAAPRLPAALPVFVAVERDPLQCRLRSYLIGRSRTLETPRSCYGEWIKPRPWRPDRHRNTPRARL